MVEQGYDWLSFAAGAGVGLVIALFLSLRRRRKRTDLVAPPAMPVEIPSDIKASLVKLRAEGRTIEAIKLLRKRTGCDLREAKAAVETMR